MTLVKVNNGFGKTIDGLMKDLFNEFPATVSKTFREDVLQFPPVNIAELENEYIVELSAPGFEKADFSVKLEDALLTISAAKKDEAVENAGKQIRREFSYKSFKRSFTLDEKIDSENISARYENGILSLTLPRRTELKAASKEINIQ